MTDVYVKDLQTQFKVKNSIFEVVNHMFNAKSQKHG